MTTYSFRWIVEAAVALLVVSGCKHSEGGTTRVSGPTTDAGGQEVDRGTTTPPTGGPALRALISERTPGLRPCYDAELRTQPELTGKITYTMEISPLGAVTRVTIEEDTVGDPELTACTRAKIEAWQFPPSPEGAEVTFPAVFMTAPE
jgi:hypothetical protein